MKCYATPMMSRLRERFERLYGDQAERCIERMAMMVGRYGVGIDTPAPPECWTQADAVLITYGDNVRRPGERPLVTLKRFLDEHARAAVNSVHILPFFPYSSDDGFSILDYREVDPALGNWDDVEAVGDDFHLMFDLVLNHCSRQSDWFKEYVNGVAPGRHYFIEADPDWDLRQVVRPRTSPLLTGLDTRLGPRHVWTTFSADQVDLDFRNPDVLFEFIDILFYYVQKGMRIVRLDAIAYAWKNVGTNCIHLAEVHELVKILRDVVEMVAPHVLVLTETNVPHEENISYFGAGDEAHLVYQFTLAPLLLHALQTGNSRYLREWALTLGKLLPKCTYLNFTASHDGIGVRPLEGVVPQEEFDELVEGIVRRGGRVSSKQNADGTESPYELNITYLDALADPARPDEGLHVARFLCSQAVALALKGIPAVYFQSLVGGRNDYEGVERTGRARSINRRKWLEEELRAKLAEPGSLPQRVYQGLVRMLRVRGEHAAFHPDGAQKVLELGDAAFGLVRTAPHGEETIIALNNLTAGQVAVSLAAAMPGLKDVSRWHDLLSGRPCPGTAEQVPLAPYETLWLCYWAGAE